MRKSLTNRTIALAALFQAVRLVQQVAREGGWDNEAFNVSVNSLIQFDADSPEAIYGGVQGVHLGLETLLDQMQPADPQAAMELTRYSISLMHLERRLNKRADEQSAIGEGLKAAAQQAEYFSEINMAVTGRIADLYQETISNMGPRIMVQGDPDYLQVSDNSSRIRALLLAGIRACVLWRQAGGNRFNLLFGRKSLAIETRRLLESL
jgi:high frequency lysogenization protein